MQDNEGQGARRATYNESSSAASKGEHEDRPEGTGKDSGESSNKRGHPQTLRQKWIATSLPNKLMVIFSALIFLATSAYAAFSGWQLWIMKEQLKEIRSSSGDTHNLAIAADTQSKQAIQQTKTMGESLKKTDELIKATNKLAIEAKRSADTAHDSVTLARNSLETQERPWLSVSSIDINENIEVGKTLSGVIEMENSGNTPALHVGHIFIMNTLCGEFPKRPPYSDDPSGLTSTRLILPHATDRSGASAASHAITEEGMKKFKAPGCHLYAYARITYSDVFGHAHWRHMCAVWMTDTPKTFAHCSSYNDGDEDYVDGKEP